MISDCWRSSTPHSIIFARPVGSASPNESTRSNCSMRFPDSNQRSPGNELSWDWSAVARNAGPLGAGLWITLLLTVAAVTLGTATGLLLFAMRRLAPAPIRVVSLVLVDVFRSLPILVTLIWLFFCLPILSGGVLRPSPFWVATIGLALNFAALYAEILRSAYDSIPHGQVEAAYGLQFTRTQFLLHVALPEAAWRSLAPRSARS